MGKQQNTLSLSEQEKNILDYEQKYFNKLNQILNSKDFISDLLLIEKEIKENYQLYKETWDLKNKFKVAAERLMRHYVYMKWHDEIKGIYPSPISSDLAIMLDECVINIDVKTIDIEGNAGDIKETALEPNQNSFDNKNYPYISYKTNLWAFDHYTSKPVICYIVKMIYSDNNFVFKLSREKYPTLCLVCIPNGHLSRLFNYNIIANFKTYAYYDEKDGIQFKSIAIPKELSNIKTYDDKKLAGDILCQDARQFIFDEKASKWYSKPCYYDSKNRVIWWYTSESNKKCFRAVKSGASVRYKNECLKERFNSKNVAWDGYKEYIISEIKK